MLSGRLLPLPHLDYETLQGPGMKQTYKGHEITITSAEISPEQLDLHVAVSWSEKGTAKSRLFTISRWFNTSEKAETYGLTWVKTWIDNKKPGTPLTIH
jgi:hypothetical protein